MAIKRSSGVVHIDNFPIVQCMAEKILRQTKEKSNGGVRLAKQIAMETAVKRHEMIALLLMPGLDEAEKRRIRSEILERENISERTLRRYIESYRNCGFEGLMPKERSDAGGIKAVPEGVLERAAEIKKELPERSVRRIIRILEGEGIVAKGELSRSTLSRHLNNMGLSTKDFKAAYETGTASRRFVRSSRNTLWQGDIKYGPYIPGSNDKKRRTYLKRSLMIKPGS